MIRFRALGVQFSLPLLILIVPLLARRLGMNGAMGPLFLALGVHELAHIAAARLARVEIREIRLMPFGGSARMENPYHLSPGRLIAVAAAGPAANLLLILLISALCQWGLLSIRQMTKYVQVNFMLMLFNLLPALPLDGGRMLYALLSRPMGEMRALNLGLWLGRGLACALLMTALWGGLRAGQWNLTLILAGVFILASERDEKSALTAGRLRRLEESLADNAEPRPARLYQLDESTSAARALNLLRPREKAWFVLTRAGEPLGLIDSRGVLQFLLKGGQADAPLKNLPRLRLSMDEKSPALN